jgi:hypothetical protein
MPPPAITHLPLILQEFDKYYRALLGTKHCTPLTPSLYTLYQNHAENPNPTSIFTSTNDQLCVLIDPITLQEVKEAIFALPKDKASGPYGFPIEFFQTYWNIISDDVYKSVTDFYHNRLDL